MSFWQGVILGLVQGITEFLPVSSSGHLVIFQQLFALENPPIFFDTLLHVSTLLAVLIYFYKKIMSLSFQEIGLIIIGTLPAIVAGLIIKPFIEVVFSSLVFVGVGLLITGTFMVLTKKIKEGDKTQPSKKMAIIIGAFQAIAIFPGISRSGSTVFGSLFLGLKSHVAFQFSFLLSIPAILGALVLQLDEVSSFAITPTIVGGMMAAFISGLFAVRILDTLIKEKRLYLFGYYCLTLGTLVLIGS